MKLSITSNFPDVQRALQSLQKDIANKAAASALNKTVAQAKTAMSKEIRAEFVMPAAKVNEALSITRAKGSGASFSLEASLQARRDKRPGFNLINFAARQTKKGVTFKIKKVGPRKLIPGSFIGNDGRTVFIRTGEAKRRMTKGMHAGKMREPIKALQTIDVSSMFNTRRINAKVVAMIETRFPQIFANEAKFFTDKFNAKA